MNLEHYQFKLRTNMLTVMVKYNYSVANCARDNSELCLTVILKDGPLTLLHEALQKPPILLLLFTNLHIPHKMPAVQSNCRKQVMEE